MAELGRSVASALPEAEAKWPGLLGRYRDFVVVVAEKGDLPQVTHGSLWMLWEARQEPGLKVLRVTESQAAEVEALSEFVSKDHWVPQPEDFDED